jgi:hypothetical protein
MMKKAFFGVIIAAVMIIAATGCGSSPAPAAPVRSERELAIERATPIRTEPALRPAWIDSVPRTTGVLSFVGTSTRWATAADARNNAQENGRQQLVDYYGTLMVNKGREFSATYGISSEVFSPQIAGQRLNERIAQNVSQALGAQEFFTQVYLSDTYSETFEVNVLMEVSTALVSRVIDDYGKEEAADLAKKAAAERDAQRKAQLEKAADFFGGNLSSSLGL